MEVLEQNRNNSAMLKPTPKILYQITYLLLLVSGMGC
jgi:hypothetical protein